jgi:hypothetical protein
LREIVDTNLFERLKAARSTPGHKLLAQQNVLLAECRFRQTASFDVVEESFDSIFTGRFPAAHELLRGLPRGQIKAASRYSRPSEPWTQIGPFWLRESRRGRR